MVAAVVVVMMGMFVDAIIAVVVPLFFFHTFRLTNLNLLYPVSNTVLWLWLLVVLVMWVLRLWWLFWLHFPLLFCRPRLANLILRCPVPNTSDPPLMYRS